MRVNGNTINVKGDHSEHQEEGGQWTANYTVTAANGNTLTVTANRETGPEAVDVFFVNKDQLWVPRGEGEGTVYVRDQ
jgi:hypothetical protein